MSVSTLQELRYLMGSAVVSSFRRNREPMHQIPSVPDQHWLAHKFLSSFSFFDFKKKEKERNMPAECW